MTTEPSESAAAPAETPAAPTETPAAPAETPAAPSPLRKWFSRLSDWAFYALAAFLLYNLFGPKNTGPEQGAQATAHTLIDVATGKKVELPGKLERPILIKAFASWCGACKRSVWIEELGDVGKDGQLEFFAVSVDDNIELARQAQQSWPIAGRVLFDASGQFSKDNHITMLPTYILIGTDGQVERVTAGLPGPLDMRAWSQAAKAQ